MKLWKFLVPVLRGLAVLAVMVVMVVMVGCESEIKDESVEIPVVERSTTPKNEKATKTPDGFAVPDNMVLEGSDPPRDVPK
jgi:hypothetical protein